MFIFKHDPVDSVTIYKSEDGNPVIEIGRFSYSAGLGIGLADTRSRVKIGNFCSIAEKVVFFLKTDHRPDWLSSYPLSRFPWGSGFSRPVDPYADMRDDILIGHDVWISWGVKILAGVSVGNGAVLCADAVVTKDVRSYAVMAGNPAQEVKRRFDADSIKILEASRWWSFSRQQLENYSPLLMSNKFSEFKAAIERDGLLVVSND
jgi:acetyltransferase-like isoleucine patch superfamily enzyme